MAVSTAVKKQVGDQLEEVTVIKAVLTVLPNSSTETNLNKESNSNI